jgi:hypothetical protein
MIVGEEIISFFAMDFGDGLRCLIERLVLRILPVGMRFDAEDDDEFKLVFVDEHLSASPELAASVARA